jgi:hypothetical protein
MPAHLAMPFGNLGPGEGVLEVSDRASLADVKLEELHDSYRVSPDTGKVIQKR